MYATGCWYYRLSLAVQRGGCRSAFNRLRIIDPRGSRASESALDDLPERIGLLSLRGLVAVMTKLDARQPLNLLAAEALAAVLVLGTDIVVTTDSPPLRAAAELLDVGYRVVTR